MSTSNSDEFDEPGYSQPSLPPAQPTDPADSLSQSPLEQERDYQGRDLLPYTSAARNVESDSDEYVPSPARLGRKGKERAKDNGRLSSPAENPIEATQYDRPNRFYGAPSTWLSWTQSERETIKSLDQERAENLSAHLYVAHKIKKHARSSHEALITHRKGRSTSTDGEMEVLEKPFVPPKVWTAWPMPPEQVPRAFHTSGILDEDDPFTMKVPLDLRQSAELEENLIAATTRIARERWEAREWEEYDEEEESSDLIVSDPNMARPKASVFQKDSQQSFAQRTQDSSPPPMLFSSQPAFQRSPSSSPESQQHPSFSHSKFRKSRPVHLSSQSRSSSPPQSLPPTASLKPVPIADDDRARTLLLPSTRRIIAELDKILSGLHRTRQAYAAKGPERSASEIDGLTETETEGETSRSRSRGRSKRKGRASGGGRKRARRNPSHAKSADTVSEPEASSEEGSGSLAAPPLPRSQRRGSSRKSNTTSRESKLSRLGLRDWSDVLGMAALTGWDHDVVARAGRRCARLFGENMAFRTIRLGGGVEEWWASGRDVLEGEEGEEDNDDGDGDEDDEEGEEEERSGVEGNSDDEEEHTHPNPANTSTSSSTPNAPKFPCPHPPCHRHHTAPFSTEENLARHLKQQPQTQTQTHPRILPHSNSPHSPFHPHHQPDATDSGLIHCPLPTCLRHHQRPFSRGSLLYRHVRNVHPEIDIGGVKGGEKVRRRSETRGARRRRGREREEG